MSLRLGWNMLIRLTIWPPPCGFAGSTTTRSFMWIRLELAATSMKLATCEFVEWLQPRFFIVFLLNLYVRGILLLCYPAFQSRDLASPLATHSFREKTSSSRRFHPWFVLNFELRSSFRFVMVVNPMRNMKSFGWRPGNSRYLLFEVWRLGMQKKLQWLTHPCVRLCEEEFVWKSFGGRYRWVFNWEFLHSLIQQSCECVHTCIRSSF